MAKANQIGVFPLTTSPDRRSRDLCNRNDALITDDGFSHACTLYQNLRIGSYGPCICNRHHNSLGRHNNLDSPCPFEFVHEVFHSDSGDDPCLLCAWSCSQCDLGLMKHLRLLPDHGHLLGHAPTLSFCPARGLARHRSTHHPAFSGQRRHAWENGASMFYTRNEEPEEAATRLN